MRKSRRPIVINRATVGTFSATWTVNSTGPITMGLVAPQGQLPSGTGVQVGSFTTQTDVQNTWADGSLRYALVSFNATSTGAKAVAPFANPGGSHTPTWPSASVAFAVTSGPGNGSTYTATLPSFDGTYTSCNGAVARRSAILVTPKTAGNVSHDNLQVIFEITSYAVGGHKVSITIQNIRNVSTMDQVTADVTSTVNGSGFSALTKSSWTIYTGQRWHRVTYVSMTEAEVLHDFEPWIDANVIPRIVGADSKTYDTTFNSYALGGGDYDGYSLFFGETQVNQGDSENAGRAELNPWTDWEARLFALNTEAYRQVVLKNANQSGGWCWAVDLAGDGITIPRLSDGTYATTLNTDRASALSGGDGLTWPSYADVGGSAAWRGAFDGGNTPGYPSAIAQVDGEHLSEHNFIPYLLTGDRFYLDNLRFQSAWVIAMASNGSTEPDPNIWPGFIPTRGGADGVLATAELGRGFGRKVKFAARAAWAMPSLRSTDYTYFYDVVSNNLTAVADYIDYIDAKGWGGSWATFVGFWPGANWGYARSNTVSSTTGASPTVCTVIGDDSGVGTGTDDHGMQTGDYVTLAGFSGGASGLNGRYAITRLSATTFSVAVNTTGSATSGVGTWTTQRGIKTPHWRIGVGAREISWIGFTGLWTMPASAWAFPDRLAKAEMAMQDYPSFSTAPGIAHNYYPSCCYVVGNDLEFYESWTDYQAANTPDSSTAYLFDAESSYTLYSSTTHRGNIEGFNPSNPNSYYTIYALVMLAHARRRGLTGAATAYTNLVAATGVSAALTSRPGFYHGVP